MGETGATVTGHFYRVTGIVHDDLVSVIKSAANEAVVGAWLRSRLDDETIAQWNHAYYSRTIGHIEGPLRDLMLRAHPGALELPETTPLADMFDADDAAMFAPESKARAAALGGPER